MNTLIVLISLLLLPFAFAESSYEVRDWDGIPVYDLVLEDGTEVNGCFVLKFDLDTGGYVVLIRMPGYLYAVSKERAFRINTNNELSELVQTINNEEEALKFVRIFTGARTSFSFDMPFEVEVGDWINFSEEDLSKLPELLVNTTATKEGNNFIIGRNLIMHGQDGKRGEAPYKLVRSKETVSESGDYKFEIKKVIVEATWLNKYGWSHE